MTGCKRITMEPMPIACQSLSELARMFGIDRSTFSRLS